MHVDALIKSTLLPLKPVQSNILHQFDFLWLEDEDMHAINVHCYVRGGESHSLPLHLPMSWNAF